MIHGTCCFLLLVGSCETQLATLHFRNLTPLNVVSRLTWAVWETECMAPFHLVAFRSHDCCIICGSPSESQTVKTSSLQLSRQVYNSISISHWRELSTFPFVHGLMCSFAFNLSYTPKLWTLPFLLSFLSLFYMCGCFVYLYVCTTCILGLG